MLLMRRGRRAAAEAVAREEEEVVRLRLHLHLSSHLGLSGQSGSECDVRGCRLSCSLAAPPQPSSLNYLPKWESVSAAGVV